RETNTEYKYSYGKLYSRVEGEWKEHTPEAGSYLETVVTALNNIYDMTSGSSGGGGGTGSWLLNMFENNNVDVDVFLLGGNEMMHSRGNIELGLFKETVDRVLTDKGWSTIDYHLALAHELAHALSFNLMNSSVREQV